jgi:hypothetical protein
MGLIHPASADLAVLNALIFLPTGMKSMFFHAGPIKNKHLRK